MTFHFFSKKKVSKYVPIFRRRKASGFALMVALGLMSFVLIIVLGLSTLVQVNSNITIQIQNNEKIIFILGLPRSGTSLAEQIISSHSLVYGAGELNYLENLITNSITNVMRRGLGMKKENSCENFSSKKQKERGPAFWRQLGDTAVSGLSRYAD